MLTSIPEGIKEVVYSFTHLCYNLLGYLPSPILYGVVCSVTGGETSRFGLVFLMLFSLLAVLFLYLATIATRNSLSELSEDFNDSYVNQLSADIVENDNHEKLIRKKSTMSLTDNKSESLSALFGRPLN